MASTLTQSFLKTLLDYNPTTGEIVWRPRGIELFRDAKQPAEYTMARWNANNAGKEAFVTPHSSGYLTGGIMGKTYYAHRVIWELVFGEDPDQIDHINGDKTDNRLCNLRSVTNAENQKNASLSKNNTSGVCGVYRHSRLPKWIANIVVNGKTKYLGSFAEFDAAVECRRKAEKKYGFHKNHGRNKRAA